MKLQIKTFFAVAAVWAIIAAGCSSNKTNGADVAESTKPGTAEAAYIRGQWYLENIVFNDSDYVRSDETVPGIRQYVCFEDSTYFIKTNCNTFSGRYAINGDSITFGDGAMTEMACDNMATEDALRRILPDISTIEIQSDSVIRLNGTTPAECILLRKATEIK